MRVRVIPGVSLFVAGLLASCTPATRDDEAAFPTPLEDVSEAHVTPATIDAAFAVEGAYRISPVLHTPLGATRVAAMAILESGAELGVVAARGVRADGTVGPWIPMEVTFAEDEITVVRANLGFVATGAQLRVEADATLPWNDRLRLLSWSALVPLPPSNVPAIDNEIAGARLALRSELVAFGVQSRAAWGARATRCTTGDATKTKMAIHHTVTAAMGDPAGLLRGIQNYHMDGRGWCDIAYHILLSIDGRVWEGRPLHLLGSHVASHNTNNIGVSFMGCFHPTSDCSSLPPTVPPAAMLDAAGAVVGELGRIYSISVNSSTVKGHRDHAGASTACPGDNVHSQLDRIRAGGTIRPPSYGAQYVSQSFPLARDPFVIAAGQSVEGYIELRNVGSETWNPGATFLGTTEPRDGASPLHADDWVSPSRAATVDRVVAPGESGRFVFSVRAPYEAGDYPQYFNVLQEGVAWFSDSGQGGPADNQLQVRVRVETSGMPPVEEDAGTPPMPTDDAGVTPPPVERDAGTGPGGEPGFGPAGGRLTGGCSVGDSPTGGFLVLSGLVVLALLGRRRRRAR